VRFISCGESLIDLTRQPGGDAAATPWLARSAGSPANTAVGLARLGRPTRLLTRLGSDGFADQLADYLASRGVDLSLAARGREPTALAIVSIDTDGQPAYAFHFAGTASFGWRAEELPAPEADTWLHLASIGWVLEPGAGVLRQWLAATATGWAGLSFDVNVRPAVIDRPDRYRAAVEPVLRIVGAAGGILKASAEDLAFLAPQGRSGDLSAAVRAGRAWHSAFELAAVVVTAGRDGAFAVDRSGALHRAHGIPVAVVDTIGAGDAFMAGFLDAWADAPGDWSTALRRGVAAGSVACQRPGAEPPTATELAGCFLNPASGRSATAP